VVAPSALAYKTDDMAMRVIHYQHTDLLSGGTDIVGEFENLIDMREHPLACVTIAGRAIRNQPGILADLAGALGAAEINIDAVSSGLDSVTFYIDADQGKDAEAVLHDTVIDSTVLSSITVDQPVGVIRITSSELPQQLNVLLDVLGPLADAYLPIHDLITSATTVAVFVNWEDGEEALELIQSAFD
jgi:aspartate kinase